MVSFLQRLGLSTHIFANLIGGAAMAPHFNLPPFSAVQASTGGNHNGFTRSKRTVAQDRRAATKARARRRAKKLGQM